MKVSDTVIIRIWAFILIALGVIWLLFEAKILSGANLAVLFRLWPIVLIAFGLELLVGRNSRRMSLLIGLRDGCAAAGADARRARRWACAECRSQDGAVQRAD